MEGERKPLLLYFTGVKCDTQTFCSISDLTKCYSRRIPEWVISRLRTVQHGWYLLEKRISKDISSFILWNPLNLKKIKVPPLKHNGTKFGNCILTSPPTTNDETCSIYLFWSNSPSIFYYQLGDKQWTKVCFYNEIKRVAADMKGKLISSVASFKDPVYCNGRLYARMWIACEDIIVVIEKLHRNVFTLNCTPYLMGEPPATSGFEQHIRHLIGSKNALFRIEILHELDRVTSVFVYKFYCTKKVWEKVESIKDRVFFISSLDSAFACLATDPKTEGGRVYIALKNCNFFYIYNIEDKSLVTSQHFPNLSINRSYSRWFMPADTGITGTLKKEIGKSHQIREKESVCDVVYLKDARDKGDNESSSLPLDVVEVIAEHLKDVFTYLHFRASNELLRLAAPPIQWRSSSSSMSMSRFDDLSMCPLFVFSDKDKVFTFLHPKHGLEYKYIINFPQAHPWYMNSEICCSKDGWLLLVGDYKQFLCFFNPFTKELLSPPYFKYKKFTNIRSFGMSHSPTSSECLTVELFGKRSSLLIYLSGNRVFIPFIDREFTFFNTSPAFHNGLFYFLSVTGKLAVLNATEGEMGWEVLHELQAPCCSNFNNFLVECDGNLLSVFESPFAKGVQVFKLIESKKKRTWMKVESLKNHMLFVGKTSFSAVANIPGMKNKIYFPRFYGKSVVFYSLETNKYHTFENDEVLNFHQMREHLNGTWIQPRWH